MFLSAKIKALPYWEGYLITTIIIIIFIFIFITINFRLVYQGNLMQTLHQLL